MKRNLRVVGEVASADPAPRMPQRSLREICALIWWWAMVGAATISGGLYGFVCVTTAVRLYIGPREPLEVLATGIGLALLMLVGLGVMQRLRQPQSPPMAAHDVQVVEYHHVHHHRYDT